MRSIGELVSTADPAVIAPLLVDQVALVTGGSRGVGKGIAEALAAAGAQVYVTGRSVMETHFSLSSDVVGKITPVRCDHTVDAEVSRAFAQIADQSGSLDVLVNNVWGGYEGMVENGEFTWVRPFWKQPLRRWDAMFDAGVRAHFVASAHAVRIMLAAGRGLIVNVSFWAAQKYSGNVLYGMSKAATDKLTADSARELREHGIAVVSLYPGLVRTEAVMQSSDFLDLSNSESPQFTGRAIASLAADPSVLERSGQRLTSADLALHFGFTDIDGSQPQPLTLDDI